MSIDKKSYFQGGGGVNEPTPGEKKYKSDPAILAQPRFKEPFYRNYDIYEIPGFEHIGPGAGYHSLQQYKSVQEFLEARRGKLKGKYVADDSWIQDSGKITKENPIKARASIFERIIKTAGPNYDLGQGLYDNMDKYDSVKEFRQKSPHGPTVLMNLKPKKKDVNHIDFPIDDQVNKGQMIYPSEESYHNPTLVGPEGLSGDVSSFPGYTGTSDQSSYINSTDIAGQHSYLPLPDEEGKSGDALDFGRDYTDGEEQSDTLNKNDLKEIMDKYIEPAETDLFGLPDGIDPVSDLDPEQTVNNEDPYTGTTDFGTQMYGDKTNV
jgi:hypothetical protein